MTQTDQFHEIWRKLFGVFSYFKIHN